MEFTNERILLRKLQSIGSYIFEDTRELTLWQTREGFYEAPGEYSDYGQWDEISIGERWRCGDSVTRWFKRTVEFPKEFEGKNVILDLEFGGEGLVRINGVIQSALTSYVHEHEATRTRVILPSSIKPGDKFEVEVEVGLNYMEFSSYRNRGWTSIEYQFRRALLAVVDDKVEEYYFDIKTAYDVMVALRSPMKRVVDTNVKLPADISRVFESLTKDTYMHERILEAVLHSLTMVDTDFDREAFIKSIELASKILKEKLEEIPHKPHALIKFVGQAHIDTAWLWPIKETVRKCGKTLANVLDLMDRYEEFVFAFSQPQLYEYTKEHYPELYERIKEKVESGQFELVGNTWVEMDTNVPSGESLVRQLLYGRAYYMEEFGKSSDVFWMPDVFGYTWALPQIIKRSGMEYFFTSKLINNDTNSFPHSLFMWQGIDGTRLLSYVQRLNYNGRYTPETVETIYNRFDQKNQVEDLMMTFGYGDGGGGPNYQMLETGRRLKSFPGLQKTEMNTSASFFEAVDPFKDKLPVWNDEMYFEHHRGTYTSQSNTKKNNRLAELGMRQVEILAAMAKDKLNADYPYEDILKAYKIILTNQFHDILPGTSIPVVFEDCDKDYSKVFSIINEIQNTAIDKLTYPAGEEDVTVFNSLSWDRCENVIVSLPDDLNDAVVVDEEGKKVPSAIIDGKIEFEAWTPALGSTGYKIVAGSADIDKSICISEKHMENKYYRIDLDEGGNFTGIYDKLNHRQVLEKGSASNLLQVFEDRPGGETAWNIDLEYQNKVWDLIEGDVQVLEETPLRGVIRVTRKFNLSTITQDITIYRSNPRIDFKTRVDWQETEKMLKAAFFVDVLSSKATYEIQFGAIERPTHWNTSYDKAKFEVCGHKWADLSEGGYGVSILNDSKYGYDIKENRMRITLLRSPINPDPTADKGIHEFCYSLFPHAGNFIDGEVVNAGYELNVPLLAILGRTLDNNISYAKISEKNVIIDTIKCAEDDRGIIIRVYESAGIRGKATLWLSTPPTKVYECNLMEEDEAAIEIEGTSFTFNIKPFEIKTFRICK